MGLFEIDCVIKIEARCTVTRNCSGNGIYSWFVKGTKNRTAHHHPQKFVIDHFSAKVLQRTPSSPKISCRPVFKNTLGDPPKVRYRSFLHQKLFNDPSLIFISSQSRQFRPMFLL